MVYKSNKIIFAVILLLIISSAAVINAEVEIVNFHAYLDHNGYVVLEWATSKEIDLDHFVISRSTDGVHWNKLSELKAKQGNSNVRREYKYIDNTVFKRSTGNFSYRLSGINKDGTSYSYPVIESVSVSSGIKHTWGTIKAMFR